FDGVLELQDFALDVDRVLLREVAAGDGRRHLGDVSHLGRQVVGHRVDVVRQVLPRAGDALDAGLSAELPLRADLAGHARHLGGEAGKRVVYGGGGVLGVWDLAVDHDGDLVRGVVG